MQFSPPHFLIHLVAAASFGFGLYYNLQLVKVPEHLRDKVSLDKFGGKWKYLTTWNMAVQLVFHWISLMNDIVGSDTQERKKVTVLQKIRDNFFAVLAFPLGVFVTTSFWTLYVIDRSLVFPEHLDEIIPNWLNHVMHSICLPIIVVELLLSQHVYPNRYKGFLGAALFICTYITWTLVIAHFGGFWVYPLLAMLNWWQLAIFNACASMIFIGLYLVGERCSQAVWAKKKQTKGSKQPKGGDMKAKKKRKTN